MRNPTRQTQINAFVSLPTAGGSVRELESDFLLWTLFQLLYFSAQGFVIVHFCINSSLLSKDWNCFATERAAISHVSDSSVAVIPSPQHLYVGSTQEFSHFTTFDGLRSGTTKHFDGRIPNKYWKSDKSSTLNGLTYQETVILVTAQISYEQLGLLLQRRGLKRIDDNLIRIQGRGTYKNRTEFFFFFLARYLECF